MRQSSDIHSPKGRAKFPARNDTNANGDVMLTYELKKSPGVPLYEALYRCIRGDILSGALRPGEKLPSKRALAQHLEISKITVETAYHQLLSEGYIQSREKVGYFVEAVERPIPQETPTPAKPEVPAASPLLDLTASSTGHFPFSVWMRLQREVMLDYGEQLLRSMPHQGIGELRHAIAEHLAAFRGMEIDPDNILIGAGTDFLYNLLIQLLGRDKIYAVEEPGYGKIRRIYAAGGVTCVSAPMDSRGVMPAGLTRADVLHLSPSHHFPTGLVTPVGRRQELLAWARDADAWIIEDDYDSEFRFDAHPMPTMQSLDPRRVIYMNSFSKTLAPSIRISYMVLPKDLMEQFRRTLGFYSCTVPSFEQYTLARFLSRGYFEKHINRMRKFYKNHRNRVVSLLETCRFADRITILEQDAGLHFLLKVDTSLPDQELTRRLAAAGIRICPISDYYHRPDDRISHTFVVNYSALDPQALEQAIGDLTILLEEGRF